MSNEYLEVHISGSSHRVVSFAMSIENSVQKSFMMRLRSLSSRCTLKFQIISIVYRFVVRIHDESLNIFEDALSYRTPTQFQAYIWIWSSIVSASVSVLSNHYNYAIPASKISLSHCNQVNHECIPFWQDFVLPF